MNRMNRMNRMNGIDLVRLFGAFCVLMLHTDYGNINQEYVSVLRLFSRWAVPFFFMVTGFFIGNKIEDNRLDFIKIQNSIIKLISIFIVSSSIYLFPRYLLRGSFPNSLNCILVGTNFHLWFIGSLIFGYLFIWYLVYINKFKFLTYISISILLLALITDSYDLLLNLHLKYSMYRFLLSIPFMHIGIYLSKKNIQFSNNFLIILIIVGFIIQFIESYLFSYLFDYNAYKHQFLIGTIIVSIPIFILSCRMNIKENKLSKWGNEYSLFIYLYHYLVYMFLDIIISSSVPSYARQIKMFFPIIGFIITLFSAMLLKKYFKRAYKILLGNINYKE